MEADAVRRERRPASHYGIALLQAPSARSDYEHVDMMCIGLSWRSAHSSYDAYETALKRRAEALDLPVEIRWLAGQDLPFSSTSLQGLCGAVFTGGADVAPARYAEDDPDGICETDEERDAAEFALLEHFTRQPLPMLGICRGAQILNVFHGGTLVHDLGPLNATHKRSGPDDKRHGVRIEPRTSLAAIAGLTGTVNSSHHQAVGRLADRFRISASAPDGTVEAYQYAAPESHPFLLAVQWHPERMERGSTLSDGVLDAFLKSVAANVPRRTVAPDRST